MTETNKRAAEGEVFFFVFINAYSNIMLILHLRTESIKGRMKGLEINLTSETNRKQQ